MPESGRIMVIDAKTQLFVGEEPKVDVHPGTVLHYTKRLKSWLFIPAKNAWIKDDRALPIEKTEAYFTNILKQKPTAEAYHHRGIAREALGFHELAIKDFDEAAQQGLKSAALGINRANTWHSLGNDRKALAELDEAIRRNPESALAYNNRSLIYAALGNRKKAIEDATHALRLDPKFAEAFNNRAVTKVKQREFKSAVADYTTAIEVNPRYADAYANRGYARKQLGDYGGALQDYRQAVELAPRSAQAFNDAAWLVATCSDKRLRDGERAIEYAKYACQLTDFKNGDYLDTLAAAYAAAGQFGDAVKTQKQAITLLPPKSRATANERLKLFQKKRAYVEK